MVKEIKIQNYKSVQDLSLELGRINVLIGANGCGKSNILEAIAFGSAAAANMLDNDFLTVRGIRITDAKSMRSGFKPKNEDTKILLTFISKSNQEYEIILSNDNKAYSKWIAENLFNRFEDIKGLIGKLPSGKEFDFLDYVKFLNLESAEEDTLLFVAKSYQRNINIDTNLLDFLIYAPENTFLRRFEDEAQIEPLGIRGEGLFKLLSVMSQETPEEFQEIIENLELIDWFEGFEIPKDLVFTERRIRIKDRFLEEGLQYFDQRSSNEGFLFLMFYFALFISKYTPKFFAIDNIDASLNPKLCIELIKILTKLAKKHDKQVIFTTHNPAILDGLNLNDDEVRLLVVSRNKEGHTKTKRITPTPVPEGEIPVRLSEKFMRGYIGGLPKNF